MIDGLPLQEREFMAPLAQRQKEGEQACDHVEPGRNRDGDDDRTRQDTQREAAGNDEYIDEYDVLQADTIERHEREVNDNGQYKEQIRTAHLCIEIVLIRPDIEDQQRYAATGENESADGGNRPCNRQFPAGQWPPAFRGMPAVIFQVEQVVEQINATGGQAKDNACQRRSFK